MYVFIAKNVSISPPHYSALSNFWENSRNKISLRCEVTITWFSAEGDQFSRRLFFFFFLSSKFCFSDRKDTFLFRYLHMHLWEVLDFVADWCNHCWAGYPRLHPEYKWHWGGLVCVCNDLPHMHRIKCPRLFWCSM